MELAMTEKTISQFLKEMTEAGFSFDFRATNGDAVYIGKASDGVLTSRKQLTAEQIKQRITTKLAQGIEKE